MAEYLIHDSTLTNIANAIREKTNSTDLLTPEEMATAIASIETGSGDGSGSGSGSGSDNTGSGSGSEETKITSVQVQVESVSNAQWLTLLTGNDFVAKNYNNSNLFIVMTPDELQEVDSNVYSSVYQWTTMFATNKPTNFGDEIWYGVGIYMMLGKGYAYPSTLNIPYGLNDDTNTNYSYLNVNSNGDVRIFLHQYDILAAGTYTLTIGLI